MIAGLFETHVNVTNLEQSMAFYGDMLGLELGRFDPDRRVAFYWVGGRGQSMLGLWEEPANHVQRQHFAFRATVEDVLHRSADWLKTRNLQPRNFLDDGTDNPLVFGWMPAVAIYFRDPDDHSLEFIAMLPDQPRPGVGIVSWAEWNRLTQSEGER